MTVWANLSTYLSSLLTFSTESAPAPPSLSLLLKFLSLSFLAIGSLCAVDEKVNIADTV